MIHHYTKLILFKMLFPLFLFSSCQVNKETHEMVTNNSKEEEQISETVTFSPYWTKQKIELPPKVSRLILSASKKPVKEVGEVTQVIPQLGIVTINGKEYTWSVSDDLCPPKWDGTRVELPQCLSIYKIFGREEWLHVWHLVSSCYWPGFEEGISKKDQEYLTNLMKRLLKQAEETIQENSK